MQFLQPLMTIEKKVVMRNKSTFWNDAEDLEARFFLLVAIPENGKVNGALDGSCEQVTG